jgi:hypothetical protein
MNLDEYRGVMHRHLIGSRSFRRSANALPLWLLAPLVVILAAAATVQSQSPYRRGAPVEISGSVADAAGAPVADVRVVLLAAHRGFALRGLRRVEEGLVRVPTRTDASGQFRLEWRWDPYYDTFRIRAEGIAAAPAAAAGDGGSRPSVLAETDLTRRILEGSPVVVALEVADAGPHREGRLAASGAVAADTQSDDQRRVFGELGKPDRVDRLEMPGGDEVAWWYFARGKSYHFRGGRLDQVMEFDPVQGF